MGGGGGGGHSWFRTGKLAGIIVRLARLWYNDVLLQAPPTIGGIVFGMNELSFE